MANHVQHMEHSSRATHGALITRNTWSTHHAQHMEHSSRATHGALITRNMSCHTVTDEGTFQLFTLTVEIAFILVVFLSLKPITDDRKEETRAPGRTPYNDLQPENSSPNRDSNPHFSNGARRKPKSNPGSSALVCLFVCWLLNVPATG